MTTRKQKQCNHEIKTTTLSGEDIEQQILQLSREIKAADLRLKKYTELDQTREQERQEESSKMADRINRLEQECKEKFQFLEERNVMAEKNFSKLEQIVEKIEAEVKEMKNEVDANNKEAGELKVKAAEALFKLNVAIRKVEDIERGIHIDRKNVNILYRERQTCKARDLDTEKVCMHLEATSINESLLTNAVSKTRKRCDDIEKKHGQNIKRMREIENELKEVQNEMSVVKRRADQKMQDSVTKASSSKIDAKQAHK